MGSTGGGNGFGKHLSGGLVVQGFSAPLVELAGDGAELGLAEGSEVDSVGEVLAQQAVVVFVGAALPGALGIAEIDGDVGGECEAAVVGEFLAAALGQ